MTEAAEGADLNAADPTRWQARIEVGGSKKLPPDPHVMDALGGNHRLETAVADLVDNAVDAGAAHVLIRFVVHQGQVQCFYVVDDGKGITRDRIDDAMTVGGVRAYTSSDLGFFGMGLKAATFSQADSLTLISRAVDSTAVGRRWLLGNARDSFECDVVGYGFCLRELSRPWEMLTPNPTGTIVRWDAIRGFPGSGDRNATSRFVQNAISRLRRHLGLVFHRFLDSGGLEIGIDVEYGESAVTGPVVLVKSLNPFGYQRPGAVGYPKELIAVVHGSPLTVKCHVWPPRSQLPQFRIAGASVDRFEGLYFYRRDRLLQAGGWNDAEIQDRSLQLARAEIHLDDYFVKPDLFRMNPEKSRVAGPIDFAQALIAAVALDGTTFSMYLDDARAAHKKARKPRGARSPIIAAGKGISPKLRKVVRGELEELPGHEPIKFSWRKVDDETFFSVDRETNTVWLNNRYRRAVVDSSGVNDAPLVKIALFLLLEKLFHGDYLGPKERDDLALWQSLLTAAVKEQEQS